MDNLTAFLVQEQHRQQPEFKRRSEDFMSAIIQMGTIVALFGMNALGLLNHLFWHSPALRIMGLLGAWLYAGYIATLGMGLLFLVIIGLTRRGGGRGHFTVGKMSLFTAFMGCAFTSMIYFGGHEPLAIVILAMSLSSVMVTKLVKWFLT